MAIAINPRHQHAYSNRGRAYLAVGRIQQAIQDFDAQIEIDPPAVRHAVSTFVRCMGQQFGMKPKFISLTWRLESRPTIQT